MSEVQGGEPPVCATKSPKCKHREWPGRAQREATTAAGWRVVAAYGLVAAATQMLWLTYAAITTESAHRYGVSVGAVGWLDVS